ncbi:MAG: glycoside hydrolase family 65 protein [Spirochaetaceae bacterium]|nr:MAG: glycoside hydrolase family 65 protein [Spirochaetaceae bacterium]
MSTEKPEHDNLHSFPLDTWRIVENEFDPKQAGPSETVFALGNGYLGIRGTFEEQRCMYRPGTYLNGFYESSPIEYGESAYGFARNNQSMLNVADGTHIDLYVNDEPFDLSTGTVRLCKRVLDLRLGRLEREVEWISPAGVRVILRTVRVASFLREHLSAHRWTLELPEQNAYLRIVSALELLDRSGGDPDDPRVGEDISKESLLLRNKRVGDGYAVQRYVTNRMRTELFCRMTNRLTTDSFNTESARSHGGRVWHEWRVQGEAGVPIELEKFVAYFHSYDAENDNLEGLAERETERAISSGVDAILGEQEMYLEEFWTGSDIQVDGDEWVQQSLRFNLFHVLQSTGRNGRTNIGAKGLTGDGYEGHYFWDTEIYALPFYTYTTPFIARRLLTFRYNILDKARDRAAELKHPGALYPWRTINGEEASAYYPAGTAQYHINADIMYAIRQYVRASGDEVFLKRYGAEMLFETARFYYDLGDYVDGRGFCVNLVTGPNEYTALVNNNLFTNLMVQDHLRYAVEVGELLCRDFPDDWSRLAETTGISERELADWKTAADAVFIARDEQTGLYPQDDTFFQKAVWDFPGTPPSHYPLLLHYHPLSIYRYQVCKQPDVVLALLLQGDQFTREEKRRNFDYYDALNTGDSSLSSCIQCVIASELGYVERAYEYFMKTARMDLDDINGNVRDGIHFANMAGCWLSLVFGFGGLRDWKGRMRFSPRLPRKWSRVGFRIRIGDVLLEVQVTRDQVCYRVIEGTSIVIYHESEELHVSGDTETTRPLPDIRPDWEREVRA